jgi:hypothetical protein
MGFHSHDPDAIEFSFVLVGRRMPHGRIFPAMRVPCEYSKEREAAPLGSAPFRGYPMAITSNRLHRDNFRSAKKRWCLTQKKMRRRLRCGSAWRRGGGADMLP